MLRILNNARADYPQEKREILKALGEAALDEHGDWILIHRERPIEIGS